MSSQPAFPPEIQEAILNHLALVDDDDFSSLKTCSLVCRAFVPITRKHIFASIELNITTKSPTVRSLERLLTGNPGLADYIRNLKYNISWGDLTNPSVQEVLKQINKLQSLSIWFTPPAGQRQGLDWINNPLRPAILHLLHLPTLLRLQLAGVYDLVAADFIPCTSLQSLSIFNHVQAKVDSADDAFSGPLPPQPVQLKEWITGVKNWSVISSFCKAQRPDGRPVFDFSSLERVTAQIDRANDVPALHELFGRSTHLTNVDLTYWQPEWISTNLSDLLRPSIGTLKHLRVSLHVNGVDSDPLAGIPGELENFRAESEKTNALESLDIHVLVQTDEDCRTGEDWGRLDEVLAKPGWPKLKRVSLHIEIASYGRQDTRLADALNKLPQEQLKKLAGNEALNFDFKVTNTLV